MSMGKACVPQISSCAHAYQHTTEMTCVIHRGLLTPQRVVDLQHNKGGKQHLRPETNLRIFEQRNLYCLRISKKTIQCRNTPDSG